jgi:hypothetical protein
MTLKTCEECGHKVSDKAPAGPNCGAPVSGIGAVRVQHGGKKTDAFLRATAVAAGVGSG